jgi:N,N-dimethylformamidase
VIKRRRFLQVAAATTAGAAVPALLSAPAASASQSYDPLQRFISLVPGGNGIIYAIQADGALFWYRHVGWQNGATTWANGGQARLIGTGWHIFSTVLGSADGQLFGFLPDGSIRWYKYIVTDLSTGAGHWASASQGNVIGTGFNVFPRVIGGWSGEIFGIDNSGFLYWYQYVGNGSSGSGAWANGNSGVRMGQGWLQIKRAWTEPNGVIYGVQQTGDLSWWRYLGSYRWANGGTGVTIGTGWGENAQKVAIANGSGTIYTIALDADPLNGFDGNMNWYRLTNSQSVTESSGGTWAHGGLPIKVGSGYSFEPTAALQSYAVTQSVKPGDTQAIAVSTTFRSYTGSVMMLAPSSAGPVQMTSPATMSGQLQLLPSGYRANGCNWQPGMSFAVPSTWQSGVYAARLVSPAGKRSYAVFVVRPSVPAAPFAFLLPTNTYNAYNTWAGHSRYTRQNGSDITLTFQRPSTSMRVDPPGVINAELYNDLFLLQWMSSKGISFDCYCDADLDASGAWLASYKALVTGGHPEYWTDAMRANVVTYLGGGGRLICTGGNGFYERTTFVNSGTALTFTPIGARDLFINYNEPESQIIGATYNPGAYFTFAPFQVDDASHPLLAGTGLATGDQFGLSGYNGAASGWEENGPIDTPNVVGTATLLAHGAGEPGDGAAMVYIDRGGGSWVFSTNSLAFNAALPDGAALSTIMLNVFKAAGA